MKTTQIIIFDPINDQNGSSIKVFKDPVDLVTCDSPDLADTALTAIDTAVNSGYSAAGFMSYELGHQFMELPVDISSGFPLAFFGIFSGYSTIQLEDLARDPSSTKHFNINNGHYSISYDEYKKNFSKVKYHLTEGNTYQVNYTFKYKFEFEGECLPLFIELLKRQNVSFAALVETPEWSILSLSPEMFFCRHDDNITVRPMKGTIARGNSISDDLANRAALERSVKNRAENIMIVDLLRNDLGRISVPGTVSPEKIFTIEEYATLFQMTSTIRSRIRPGISWKNIFNEIFPSGSVTGAPKKRTMEIIKELEPEPRNIYTGSLGYILPDNSSLFNVAIRTLVIDKQAGTGEMGIGSGLVYDSDASQEYDECLLKGKFFTDLAVKPSFRFIETLLFENGGYFLMDRHINRISVSAKMFTFPYDPDVLENLLYTESENFQKDKKYKVRVLLDNKGDFTVSSEVIDTISAETVKITVSVEKTDKDSVFYYHKTTNRQLYDKELEKARNNNFFEVVFFNTKGELTEGSITNIILKLNGKYYTPPVECGLLPGTYRDHLIETGEIPLSEKILHMEDLKNAEEILLVNSVRKIIKAELA